MHPTQYVEVPAEHVDATTRALADRWAAKAAAELDLPALGVPRPSVRWFGKAGTLKYPHPSRESLALFEGGPTMAGKVDPGDALGTIWLRFDLAPTPDHQQLAHFVGHELRHVLSHALGRSWARVGEERPEEEAACERYASDFCARLKAGLPYERRQTAMPTRGHAIVNGQFITDTEAAEEARRARTRAWMEKTVGAEAVSDKSEKAAPAPRPKDLSLLVQGAVVAKDADQLGTVLSCWEQALDAGRLNPVEAELALNFITAAHDRLEQKEQARATKDTPPASAIGGYAPRLEYSTPIGGIKVT